MNKPSSSKHSFLRRCVSIVPRGTANFDLCEVVQLISGAALAHDGSQQAMCHGRALVGGRAPAGHTWSCAELGQLFSTVHCPHSGTGQPLFSSQPPGKALNGGTGNTGAPSPLSSCLTRALWRGGCVAALRWQDTLQLGQGHAHTACLIHHHLRET